MKIIKTIKVDKSNIHEIRSLECVDGLEWCHDGKIMVHLDPKFTEGRLTLTNDEYLCQFENGMWQRFGAVALDNVFKNPGREDRMRW